VAALKFWGACSLVVMAGCVSTPASDGTVYEGEVPAVWSSDYGQGAIETDWWTEFDDEKLNRLVVDAISLNPGVRQAEARTAQARAQARIAGADRLPQLSGVFNGSNAKQLATGFGPSGGGTGGSSFETETYGLALNVNWEIDLWGRIASLNGAAREDFLASEDNLRAVRQSIAAQTAKTYFAVVEARAQLDLSEKTVAALQETARQIGNRADAGIVSPTDKQLSITNYETANAGLQQRRETLERVIRQLEVIVRQYPTGTALTGEVLPGVSEAVPAGLPAGLLARRPDVLASERALRASGLRTSAARRALLPSISLTGSIGTSSSDVNNLLDGDFSVWSIAGQLVQPIFQGGRLRANVALSRARQREAAEAYAETVLLAFSEVESALAADQYISEREASFQRAADAAADAERIAINRYNQGITSFLTVLESQQRALDTRSAYLSARRARLDNRIDLYLALGGGFDTPISLPLKGDSE